MANLNKLAINAAQYTVNFIIPVSSSLSLTFSLLTLTDISYSIKKSSELLYAVGSKTPIANPSNQEGYEGKLSMQAGELLSILDDCGFVNATEIEGATLGIHADNGTYSKVFGSVSILSEALSVKAGDKDSKIDLDFNALSVSNG